MRRANSIYGPTSAACGRLLFRMISPLFLCSVLVQAPLLEAFSAEARSSSVVVSCGPFASSAGPAFPATFGPAELVDGTGRRFPAVWIRREGYAVLRAELPSAGAGTVVYKAAAKISSTSDPPLPQAKGSGPLRRGVGGSAGAGPALPKLLVAGGAVRCEFDGGGGLDLDPDGSTSSGELRFEVEPKLRGGSGWRLVETDPLRSVFQFTAPSDDGGRFDVFVEAFPTTGRSRLSLLVQTGRSGERSADHGFVVTGSNSDAMASGPSGEDDECEEAETGESEVFLPEPDQRTTVAGFVRPERVVVIESSSFTCFTTCDPLHGPRRIRNGPRGARASMLLAGETADAGESRRLDLLLCRQGDDGRTPYVRSLALPSLLPGGRFASRVSGAPHLSAIAEEADAALRALRSDPRRGLGVRREDAGDWKMDAYRFGNLEWDTTLGLLLRHLDRGDPADFGQAMQAAEHLLQRDRDAARSGLFFLHGAGHRSGMVEPGHHWTEGLRLASAMTDDPRLRDALPRIADEQIASLSRIDLDLALPRSLGWGLLALVSLHDVATDRKSSEKTIRRLRDHVVLRWLPEGRFALERAGPDPDAPYRTSPFVETGIVLPALVRAEAVAPSALARERIKKAAAAAVRDSYDEIDGRRILRRAIWSDPVRGRPLKKTGEAGGEERLLFLAGLKAAGIKSAAHASELAQVRADLLWREKTFVGKEASMLLRALADLAPP